MYVILISLVIGLFLAMLFLNVYFRVKVLKVYKVLVQNKVQFGSKHIFNTKRMEQEILPRYPQQKENILLFVRHIKYSIRLAVGLILLITFLGCILMYFK